MNVNIAPGERIARMLVGALATVTGVALLAGASSAVAFILELMLVIAGADLIVTGAIGHCPLYQKLGHEPRSQRGSP